jgi:hypothetical protein
MSTTADDDETTLEVTDRASDYLTTLDRMVNLTFIADAKAAPILAAHATVAAVTTTQLDELVSLMRDGSLAAQIGVAILATAYLVCAIVSVVLTLRVFMPQGSAGQGSLLYFADIANMGQKDFVARSLASSADDLARDALEQTYVVAGIAASKFRRVRLALLLMIGAAVAWLALMALANY